MANIQIKYVNYARTHRFECEMNAQSAGSKRSREDAPDNVNNSVNNDALDELDFESPTILPTSAAAFTQRAQFQNVAVVSTNNTTIVNNVKFTATATINNVSHSSSSTSSTVSHHSMSRPITVKQEPISSPARQQSNGVRSTEHAAAEFRTPRAISVTTATSSSNNNNVSSLSYSSSISTTTTTLASRSLLQKQPSLLIDEAQLQHEHADSSHNNADDGNTRAALLRFSAARLNTSLGNVADESSRAESNEEVNFGADSTTVATATTSNAQPGLMTPPPPTSRVAKSTERRRTRIPGPAGDLGGVLTSDGSGSQVAASSTAVAAVALLQNTPSPSAARRVSTTHSNVGGDGGVGVGGVARAANDGAFRSASWLALLESRDLPPFGVKALLPRTSTLVWIKREGAWKKAPNVVVYVKQVTLTETDAVIVAKDPTGEMLATVHVRFSPFVCLYVSCVLCLTFT